MPTINAAMEGVFIPELTARVTAPVLNVVGERSEPGFLRGADSVQSWFPHAERFTLCLTPPTSSWSNNQTAWPPSSPRFLRAHPID